MMRSFFNVRDILTKIVDLETALNKHPEIFNFDEVSVEEVATIYSQFPSGVKSIEDWIVKKPVKDRINFYCSMSGTRAQKLLRHSISDADVDSLDKKTLESILESSFRIFATKERISKLSKTAQNNLYVNHYSWFFKNGIKFDLQRFDTKQIRGLIKSDPDQFGELETFDGISMSSQAWCALIDHKPDYYLDKFIKSTRSLATKTDVRQVVYRYPEVVKLLNESIIADSKLSVKEWILLIKQVIGRNEDVFKNWSFDDNFKFILKMDALAELLTGKSKSSIRYQRSIKAVLDPDELEEKENDDE